MCAGVILRIPNLRLSIIDIFFSILRFTPAISIDKHICYFFRNIVKKVLDKCLVRFSHGRTVAIFESSTLMATCLFFLSEIVRLSSVSIQYLYKSNLSQNFNFINVSFDSSMLRD